MTTPFLGRAESVLLDFDGPVCSVFSGFPASDVAALLRGLVSDAGGPALPFTVGVDPSDPLGVLRTAAGYRPELVPMLDDALTGAELLAVRSAAPTPGVQDFLHDCRLSGRRVVVVSNNSATAVSAYLQEQGMIDLVECIVGRPVHRPLEMKPHPLMVTAALAHLGAPAWRAVLIGDSVTDIEAARRCGVPSIGFANQPGKDLLLAAVGADQVIDSMRLLVPTAA